MYNEPIREFIRLLKAGLLTYNESQSGLLSWCINNLVVRKNNKGEWMPDKEKSPDKIDLAVAVLMAFAEAIYTKPRGASRPYSGEQGTGIFG